MKTLSKLFSGCFTSFWRFWPIFSFCVVKPYLSFSSSKFNLILKRFGQRNFFSLDKVCFDILSKKSFLNNFQFLFAFLMFLIDFQFLCILVVSVVSQQVLNDLNCFGRVQSKNVFYDEHFFLAAWSWKLHYLDVLHGRLLGSNVNFKDPAIFHLFLKYHKWKIVYSLLSICLSGSQ